MSTKRNFRFIKGGEFQMLLKDKIALVTGSGSGLGRTVAKRFAGEGAVVLLAGRKKETLKETETMIRKTGGKAHSYVVDLSIDSQVHDLAARVLKDFPHLDILINNAGISKEYTLLDMPVEVWDEIFQINLRAVMLLTKAFLPSMVERGRGNIVNIGSGAALRGLPGSIPYAVSKAGVVCFSQTLGDEVRKYGIRVNSICPGPIDTEMFQKSAVRDFILAGGGDVFSPETVANGVLYLASPLSEGMNSQTLTLRGFNRW